MSEEVESREEEDEEEAANVKVDRQWQRTRCQLHDRSCISNEADRSGVHRHIAIWAKMKSELVFQ